jgi:hypothetical protein
MFHIPDMFLHVALIWRSRPLLMHTDAASKSNVPFITPADIAVILRKFIVLLFYILCMHSHICSIVTDLFETFRNKSAVILKFDILYTLVNNMLPTLFVSIK